MTILKKLKILFLTTIALIGLEARATDDANNYDKKRITISGSDTFENNVLYTEYEIKNRTGFTIDTKGDNSITGIMDLVDGKADLAMTSASLEMLAKKMKGVDTSKLKEFEIKEVEIGFFINPKNKVDTLSIDQIRKIYTGEITNWKEVGGEDIEILILSKGKNSGTETMLDDALGIKTRSKNIKEEPITRKLFRILCYGKGAITSYQIDPLLKSHISSGTIKILKTDHPYKQKLYLVTKGEPNSDAKKIIDLTRELAKD
jgi:phosphate transport system substrate-binding protein